MKNAHVLTEVAHLATVDMARVFDKDGNLLPIHKIPEDVRCAIAEIESEEVKIGTNVIGHVRKIKLRDKNKALEICARHLKMLTDKVSIKERGKKNTTGNPLG